jgi:radical SAM protein with 4Fe4S-binding SPASM domain
VAADAGGLPAPIRARRADDNDVPKPLNAVWELTMKCDQPCAHCGSRAGAARVAELSTAEIVEVGRALARLGCREVSLIGGEAYLRKDILEIVRALADLGLLVSMQTGGRAMTAARAQTLKDAGLTALGVSVDGLASAHDRLRGNLGSHMAAIRALDAAREAGLVVTANTQINKLNAHQLVETSRELRAHGIQSWQVQLTVAMGRAADHPAWIVDPWDVVPIIDTLAKIQLDALRDDADAIARGKIPFNVVCGNNLGYFGPHELVMRSRPGGAPEHWAGCVAGVNVIGIESDGTVKGCPSLPTAPYTGGNVRDLSLEEIWRHADALKFARERSLDELWGHCRSCYYADTCGAGCSWTTHATLGKRGNNPFCYHRVIELRKKGVRERLVPVEQAPNLPYDFGRFEIVEEPIPAVDEARVTAR